MNTFTKEHLRIAIDGMRKYYFKRDEIMFQNYAQSFHDIYEKAKHTLHTPTDEEFSTKILQEFQTVLNRGRVVFPNLEIRIQPPM